jgi:hypothetical protein
MTPNVIEFICYLYFFYKKLYIIYIILKLKLEWRVKNPSKSNDLINLA